MQVGGQQQAPAELPPEIDLLPIVQEDGWVSEPVWIGAGNSRLTGVRLPDRTALWVSLSRPTISRHYNGVSGQQHAPAALYPRERPGTHFTGGWVGPSAGLDGCGKSRPQRDSIPDRPVRSQSLYRLSYPAHGIHNYH